MVDDSQFAKSLKRPAQWVATGIILLFFAWAILQPKMEGRMLGPHVSPVLQSVRAVGVMMFAYAQDHDGAYPTGKSSTEVFQKLIDEGYVTDTSIFFCEELKTQGKIKASSNKLKPENVCWDVTIPLDASSSDSLPMVLSSGYRINYVPGLNATPILCASRQAYDGIAVCCVATTVCWRVGQPDGTVTKLIPVDFDPKGKKYQQLTPEGSLPLSC